jgi:hypothetical protein
MLRWTVSTEIAWGQEREFVTLPYFDPYLAWRLQNNSRLAVRADEGQSTVVLPRRAWSCYDAAGLLRRTANGVLRPQVRSVKSSVLKLLSRHYERPSGANGGPQSEIRFVDHYHCSVRLLGVRLWRTAG